MSSQLLHFTIITFILVKTGNVHASSPIEIKYPKDCEDGEFYDQSLLRCSPCGDSSRDSTNYAVWTSLFDNKNKTAAVKTYQRTSLDQLSCNCLPGSYRVRNHGSIIKNKLECLPCPEGQVTATNGFGCAKCEPPTAYDNMTKTCACKDGIKTDQLDGDMIKQSCKSCPNLTQPDVSGLACVPCQNSFLTANSDMCDCPPTKAKVYGGTCIPVFDVMPEKQNLYLVKYNKVEQLRSAFLVENFQAAAYNCKHTENRTACQVLGNLCVLLHYSFYDNLATDHNACSEYRKLMAVDSTSSVNSQIWPKRAPWLYYGPDSKAELSKTNVANNFRVNTKMTLIAFRYSADGVLREASELNPGELQLCKESHQASESGYTFGTNYVFNCVLSAEDLWKTTPSKASELLFYDLYLLSSDGKQMYPIPVLIKNLKKNGELINNQSDSQDWQLVRRFYLSEALTGIVAKADETSKKNVVVPGTAKVLRYAKHIEFDINLRDKDGSGTIYPPQLIVVYDELTKEDTKTGTEVPIKFKVTYWMNQNKAERNISISLTVLCSFGILWSIFRTWGWSKRAGKQAFDPSMAGKFLVLSCETISNVFFFVNVCAAINWFVLYKKQSAIHTLLPTPDQEEEIYIYLTIAFVLKLFQIIHELAICSSTNLFFIDWEKPQVKNDPKESKPRSSHSRRDVEVTFKDDNVVTNRRNSSAGPGRTNEKMLLATAPNVSIWRTYFVANEWLKLSTRRRLNLGLHVLLVIFCMKTIGLENFPTSDTKARLSATDAQRHVPMSTTCRVALGVIVYVFVALAQIGFRKLVYERYFQDKLNEFVDLCSVSNISVFCMVHQRFGYYIHGKSANARADVNMKEMHEFLKREEDDKCPRRGLLPESDQQTFEMSLPSAINEQYERIRSMLFTYSQGADRMQGIGGHLSRVDIEKVVPTYLTINHFLSSFIEHTFKDMDYIVKPKKTIEAVLDVEFCEPRGSGFLYNDCGHSFEKVMFFGLEYSLLLFELMTFIVTDLVAVDFTVSAIFTYMFSQVIKRIYLNIARKNLVKKALVDERFLM